MKKNYKNLELIEIARKYVEEAEINAERNPTSDTIQVVIVEPHKKPYKAIIDNELDAFQKIVGGYIENFFIGTIKEGARLAIVLNEEGKIKELPYNRHIVGLDILVGTLFITAYNLEGNNVSLTDEEAEKYIRIFSPIEVYL